MPLVIVVGGPAGTGKTTTAELLSKNLHNSPFVEGDSLHPKANVDKMASGVPLTDDDRWGWLKEVGQMSAKKAAESSQGISIASCSILKKAYRDHIKKNAGDFPDTVFRFVFLHTSYDELMKRVEGRHGHYMKLDMVRSQYDIMEIPLGSELIKNGGDSVDVDATGKSPHEVLDTVMNALKGDSIDV